MPAPDPNTRDHLEWLGFIQPNGLVVSAPALVKAGAILNATRVRKKPRYWPIDRVLDEGATPELAPPGAVVLPYEKRRRSGSHYAPRELTEHGAPTARCRPSHRMKTR